MKNLSVLGREEAEREATTILKVTLILQEILSSFKLSYSHSLSSEHCFQEKDFNQIETFDETVKMSFSICRCQCVSVTGIAGSKASHLRL